jgi:hypothetical protein
VEGGKRSLPFLLATWGLGGRGFGIANVRHNLDEYKIVRVIGVTPHSDVERRELTDISIKI